MGLNSGTWCRFNARMIPMRVRKQTTKLAEILCKAAQIKGARRSFSRSTGPGPIRHGLALQMACLAQGWDPFTCWQPEARAFTLAGIRKPLGYYIFKFDRT